MYKLVILLICLFSLNNAIALNKIENYQEIIKNVETNTNQTILNLKDLYKNDSKRLANIFANLAECYSSNNAKFKLLYPNQGCKVNYDLSRILYEQSAELGNSIAQMHLAIIYDQAIGVKQDKDKSFKYAKSAAEQGLIPAMLLLANKYEKGDGVSVDYIKAYAWYYMSSDTSVSVDSVMYKPTKQMLKLEQKMPVQDVQSAKNLAKKLKKKDLNYITKDSK